MAYSIEAPTENVDLRPALKVFPKVKALERILRPIGDVDLLLGIQDADLPPYLAKPIKHCKGKLCLLTSRFGSGYLLDGSHPKIKVTTNYLSPEAKEKSRGTFITRKGIKKPPKVSHRTSRVSTFDLLECEELGTGRTTEDDDLTDNLASSEVRVVSGSSQVSPS